MLYIIGIDIGIGRSTFYCRCPDLADVHTHNLRTDRIDPDTLNIINIAPSSTPSDDSQMYLVQYVL